MFPHYSPSLEHCSAVPRPGYVESRAHTEHGYSCRPRPLQRVARLDTCSTDRHQQVSRTNVEEQASIIDKHMSKIFQAYEHINMSEMPQLG